MRRRWSAFLIGALLLSPQAWAQTQADEDAGQFTNGFLLAQSERDRRIFIGALMAGTATAAGFYDEETGECLAHWYMENRDRIYADAVRGMEAYPERRPVEVIYALAVRVCPGLLPDAD